MKPIAYRVGVAGALIHSHCWTDFEQHVLAQSGSKPAMGTLFANDAPELRGKTCGHCQRPFLDHHIPVKEVVEDICGHFGFRVRWVIFEHRAEVEVFEITARENGNPCFNRLDATSLPDPVPTIEEAEVYLEGYVKWDGCTELDQGRPHWCSPTDYRKHCALIHYICVRSFELMERERDDALWDEVDPADLDITPREVII